MWPGRAASATGASIRPRAVEDAAGEVLRLAHDRGERGADERRLLLVRRSRPAGSRATSTVIGSISVIGSSTIRLPARSVTASASRPAPTTSVDSRSSTIAGPVEPRARRPARSGRRPASRRSRARREVRVARALAARSPRRRRARGDQLAGRGRGPRETTRQLMRLDRHVRAAAAVERARTPPRTRRPARQVARPAATRDPDLVALADVAHVGERSVRDLGRAETRRSEQRRPRASISAKSALDSRPVERRRRARAACARSRRRAARRGSRRALITPAPSGTITAGRAERGARRRTRAPARRRRRRRAAAPAGPCRARRRARARRWPCSR